MKEFNLAKTNNKNKSKQQIELSLGAKVFVDELKRLNKGPNIEFKKESLINGGVAITFRVLKKYTLIHKLPNITGGTTALYNIRRKNKNSLNLKGDLSTDQPSGCFGYDYNFTQTKPTPSGWKLELTSQITGASLYIPGFITITPPSGSAVC
jgi:hypothetical protein